MSQLGSLWALWARWTRRRWPGPCPEVVGGLRLRPGGGAGAPGRDPRGARRRPGLNQASRSSPSDIAFFSMHGGHEGSQGACFVSAAFGRLTHQATCLTRYHRQNSAHPTSRTIAWPSRQPCSGLIAEATRAWDKLNQQQPNSRMTTEDRRQRAETAAKCGLGSQQGTDFTGSWFLLSRGPALWI